MRQIFLVFLCISITYSAIQAQGTRLLRQPNMNTTHITYTYGGDIWVTNLEDQRTLRITSTGAVEQNPHISPDGKTIAFTSNRSGIDAIYTVSIEGGNPTRLTWHPSSSNVRGWTNDGGRVLYSSTRETAPTGFGRLWTVSKDGGPATMLAAQWGHSGSFSPDGSKIAIDRMRRWDSEWRAYRGGQNTPLVILNLNDMSEELLPNEKTTDTQPLWLGDQVYFLSDRDLVMNIWSYSTTTKEVQQITKFEGSDIKWLNGNNKNLVYEREGYLHLFDLSTKASTQLDITVSGDFPWAEVKWEDVGSRVGSASLSPSGKRALMAARGDIFTVPVEHGDARNMTKSSDGADRAPLWSPKGGHIAWFSDAGGKGYSLIIAPQDGLSESRSISIGESKMAWEPEWSPDGKYIAFVDDDVRIRVVNIETGNIETADVGGTNLERGANGIAWSTDSKWLAYSKSGSNNLRQILVWSQENKTVQALTNSFADSFSPSWDRDSKHLYFLASTDVALQSGWANTSSMTARPEYAPYVMNLRNDEPSPFTPRSDEEDEEEEKDDENNEVENDEDASKDDESKESKKGKKKNEDNKDGDSDEKEEEDSKDDDEGVVIDFDGIDRRIISLPMPARNYRFTMTGPAGSVFIGESVANSNGMAIHKFDLKEREAKEYISGAGQVSLSSDGKKMLARVNGGWKVMDTGGSNGKDGKSLKVNLKMKLDRSAEWAQIFEEAWRYEQDYFYDKNMHGRDWDEVHDRYAPLVPFVKHRADLTYILDQVNGELSVGHSFVFGGDFPETERPSGGLLGADLAPENNRWRIKRIYTTESWNPRLSSPLDRPELKISEGDYLLGVNGNELTASDNPYEWLDGTAGVQTIIHIHQTANFDSARKEIVKPIRSENALRQRAWVEDNRRLVDKLSNGQLGYVWVPNTSGPGFVSFNRYYFAQQDKRGAVIDERFNGGGLLDDYMVDLMTRSLRAAITNEVPNGKPLRLPAGILGPKVLLVNELAGSGGDFFPWVFRQQNAGPLIGATTWGGLVKSSVHYGLVDGGALTAPDNAVFDPINGNWIGENVGIPPDIFVRQDAQSLDQGKDPQLERAVQELMKLIGQQSAQEIKPPAYSEPAKGN